MKNYLTIIMRKMELICNPPNVLALKFEIIINIW